MAWGGAGCDGSPWQRLRLLLCGEEDKGWKRLPRCNTSPGEHNGNAILRLVKQEPHMISLKAGDTLVGLSVTLPGLLSPPAVNRDGGDSPSAPLPR